jgi:hypothetical protein
MLSNKEYQVVKDNDKWGIEWRGALINDNPLSKRDAKALADECNAKKIAHYGDENPRLDEPSSYM